MRRKIIKWFGYFCLGVIFVMAAIYTSLAWSEGAPSPEHAYFQTLNFGRPLVIAHRGGAGLAPENTLNAFENSARLGVDVLELDVHASSDGALVVIHDRTVDRTTDGTGRVNALSLAEIKRLDAGFRFSPDGGQSFPLRGRGVRVPTLEEVFAAFPEAKFNIEPKQHEPSLVAPLCEMITARKMTEKVVVASFNQTLMDEFRRACPKVATGAGPSEVTKFLTLYKTGLTESFSPSMQALQIPENAGWLNVVNPDFIKAAHERNLKVHVWTINNTDDMKRLIEMGVDGIMTDYPDRLLGLLKKEQVK